MTMSAKHTPGPWIVMRGGWTEEGFAQYELHGNRTSCIADARLIAAAPELLEALQAVIDHGSMTGADWVSDKARAAIAKATGEPS
jgi:hypothetical protein